MQASESSVRRHQLQTSGLSFLHGSVDEGLDKGASKLLHWFLGQGFGLRARVQVKDGQVRGTLLALGVPNVQEVRVAHGQRLLLHWLWSGLFRHLHWHTHLKTER
jgi:hypothetical protein